MKKIQFSGKPGLLPIPCLALLAFLSSSSTGVADPIDLNPSGLAEPVSTIAFDEVPGIADTAQVSTEWADLGVTFVPNLNYRTGDNADWQNITASNLRTGEPEVNPFSIKFGSPLTSAAFALIAQPPTPATITAKLNGEVVESFETTVSIVNPNNFFGFEGITFDEIEVGYTADTRMRLDNLQLGQPAPTAYIIDFSESDGGFTVTNENHDDPWAYDAGAGTWSTDGSANGAIDEHTRLTSPELTVDTDGLYVLSFDHRYDIEGGDWDGGGVFIRVNGGSFRYVEGAEFTENGYNTGSLIGAHALGGLMGFGGISPGHAAGTYITSTAGPFPFSAGDIVQVEFLMANDQGSVGTMTPNWELDSLTITLLDDNDLDGIPNEFEELHAFLNPDDPADAALDEDSDGLSNLAEFEMGTIIDNPDSDGDTLLDGVETNTGIWVSESDRGTDPLNADSDGDGLSDGVENHALPYDRQNPETQPGSDPNNVNTDGDAALDGFEIANGSDPTNSTSFPAFTEFLEFRYQFDSEAGPLVDTSGKDLSALGTPSNGPAHRFGAPSLVGGDGFSIGLDAPGTTHPTGSYLLVPDPPNPDSFTFSIWIKPNKPGEQNPIYSRENVWWPSPGVFYSLLINGSGGLVWITGENQNFETDPGLIVDGEIYHIVVTHADSDGPETGQSDWGRLYVNGVLVAEVENPTEVPTLESRADATEIYRSIWLGSRSSGPGYKGEFDDFQMYSTELTPVQIEEMYSNPGSIASFVPPPPFEITSIVHDEAAGSVTFTWNSVPGKSYSIDSSTDLTPGEWGEVTDSWESQGTETSFTQTGIDPGTLRLFYRVREE